MCVQALADDDPTHEVKLVISDREGQSCHFRKGVVNQPKRKVQQNHVIPSFIFFSYFFHPP